GVTIIPGNEGPSAERSPYIIRPIDRELSCCQRYWETGVHRIHYRGGENAGITSAYDCIEFKVSKRAAPSITMSNWQYYNQGTGAVCTPSTNLIDTNHFEFLVGSLTNFWGWVDAGTWTANARVI